jgi:hypothetical protein
MKKHMSQPNLSYSLCPHFKNGIFRVLFFGFVSLLNIQTNWCGSRLSVEFGMEAAFAQGNSVALARRKFANGDIHGAEKDLSRMLRSGGVKGTQREEAQKLLGICQYLIGNVPAATRTFEGVLEQNPNARLNPRDVMDPGIQSLFSRIQTNARATSRGKRLSLKAQPPAGRPQQAAPQITNGRFTGVLVKSNAPNTTVFSNGIFIGTASQDIALDPGSHNISVAAPGFEAVTRSFSVKRGERLTVSVTLLKEGERARMKAIAAAKERARRLQEAREAARLAAEQRRQEQQRRLAEQKALAEERAFQRQMALEEAKLRRQEQQALAGPYGQGNQGSLADEFLQDQQGANPYGGQAYGQNPYGQPPYAPPPQQNPYAPPSQQNPYAPPQQYAQPNYAPPQQYEAPQAYQPPAQPVPNMYSEKEKPRAKPQASGGKSVFLAILPFGVGQFQNGNGLLGGLFVVTDAGGLAGYFYFDYVRKKYEAAPPLICEDTNDPNAECVPDADSKKFVSTQKTYSYIGLGVFAGGWLLGALEATMSMDKPKSKAGLMDAHTKSYAFEESKKNETMDYSLRPNWNLSRNALEMNLKIEL